MLGSPSSERVPVAPRVVIEMPEHAADEEEDEKNATACPGTPDECAAFASFYDDNVDFVHRGARRLGIEHDAVEDVVQEVFLVAHRRRSDFRGDASVKTWLYGILINVSRLHRRTAVRSALHGVIDRAAPEGDTARVADARGRRPDALAEAAEAYRILLQVLDQLDDDKREVFVLAELEQLTIPEIADIVGIKVNTAYSRLRLARAAFQDLLARTRRQP
jgi:RNA polymerase sigma-70 factor (ECF subfamily)